MIRRSKAAALAAFAMLCSLVIVSAEARREWQAFGGGGDATTRVECPAGQVMVGIQGRSGQWATQLRVVCAPLTGAFSTGNAQGLGGYLGGGRGGDSPDEAICPSNSVMSSLGFSLTPEKGRVAYIVIGCTGPGGEHPILAFGSSDAPREGCGKALGIIPTGCQPAGDDRVQTCAQEQFVGLTVRSGRDVNAIGAICDRRDPPPPPPVAKPIHRTGGNRPLRPIAAAPSGPPLAIRTTIQGSWKMTAGEDHYNLILTPSGSGLDPFNNDRMPLGLGGYVIDAERPDAVAGLQGALPEGRVATIAYVMPSGVAGNCQLTYATDGQSLQGSCIVNGQSVTWRGTRGEWPRTPSQNRAAAAGAAAVGGDAGGGRSVTVKLDVDVYAQAGGEGQSIASLNAGTDGVTLVGACKGDWCHVKWAEGDGWVYSGSDYNSLGR